MEMSEAVYRHEWKHEINYADMLAIRARARAVMTADEHAVDGKYQIRSLYFDNIQDKALREKIDGIGRREKFRIRCYDNNTSLIRLEKKSKIDGLGTKHSAILTEEETRRIIRGDLGGMMDPQRPLLQELCVKMNTQGLRPRTIVSYTREPYVFAAGNVRVTFDYDIRTGLSGTDFLDPGCRLIPAGGPPIILEVKWDAFLPDIIRDVVNTPGRWAQAFSKYAQCRMYD